jgi:hypothetical protein
MTASMRGAHLFPGADEVVDVRSWFRMIRPPGVYSPQSGTWLLGCWPTHLVGQPHFDQVI